MTKLTHKYDTVVIFLYHSLLLVINKKEEHQSTSSYQQRYFMTPRVENQFLDDTENGHKQKVNFSSL